MSTGLEQLLPHIPAFLLVLFRLTGIFIFGPVFGSSVIPMRAKVLLALVLAFCIYPVIPPQVPVQLSLMTLAVAVGTELLIGLVIGYGASLPLVAMQIGGLMMGHQLGLGLAQVFNPEFNEQTEIMSQLLFFLALVAFLLLGGHHAMLVALVHSFESVPLGGYRMDGSVIDLVVGLLTATFELGIRVAAPLLCLVFLETIAMGFVARTVPQLNILSLGFPLRILLGFLLVAGIVATMFDAASEAIYQMMRNVIALFSA
jgi:flagellar biosynthetic protein FliR